jgi:small-conductance mechanosensitive channel
VNTIQKLIIQHIDIANNSGIKVRAINTQVILLKKIVQAIIIIVTIAAGLMTFDSVRNLGAGLLTTAGVLGAIGAFASQQSLSRLFTGIQLAFTQPIKIGDMVIIENENGLIEEITLSYVVVKLWDLRRLILPTDYFFSKGLQNLTRNSTELLGTIFIYADYTLPIDQVREQFFEYVKSSELWNKNVATFQVTDVKENSLELRGLVSADDAPALWNLRCELREKLIRFIVTTYPNALPLKRNITL